MNLIKCRHVDVFNQGMDDAVALDPTFSYQSKDLLSL